MTTTLPTAEQPNSASIPTVGQPIRRQDGPVKVTGAAKYAVEHLAGRHAAYAWPVQSTIASGRVTSVDVSSALRVPGVIDVLTNDNAFRLHPDGPTSPAHGAAIPDLLLFQDTEIHYRGQIIAAVVAETLEGAREGAAAVTADYEEREPRLVLAVGDERAITPDIINDLSPGAVARGDADTAFDEAAVRVDQTYATPAHLAQPMEPHAALAHWEGDHLTLYCSDQGPSWTAVTISGLLGIGLDQIEVVCDHVGGGFGSKAAPRPPMMLAVLAARLVDRPVKVALSRAQMADLTTYRSPTIQRVRLGSGPDGRMKALIHESTSQSCEFLPYADQVTSLSRSLYAVPDCRTHIHVVPLNVTTPGWLRAPGEAPGNFALESAVDELAEHVGIDPVDLRVLNEPSQDPETGQPFSSRGLVRCLRTGAEMFGWDRRDPVPAARRDGRWLIGMGVASAAYPVIVFPSSATASVTPERHFTIEIGAVDIGTGARTVLHQLAADALSVGLSEVTLRMGRSSFGAAPFAGGSMGTGSWGWAIDGACRELLQLIDSDGIPLGGLRVTWDSSSEATPSEYSRHSFGAHFASVRVDASSGEVRVDRLLGVYAAGRIINPVTARSQAIGSMTMGIGMALMESAEPDHHIGGWLSRDLASYHIPANADIRSLNPVFLDEEDDEIGPSRGKGIGEIGIVGVPAAIANAIYNATGTRIRTLPALPERVFAG